jgi:hypothetical protein
MIEETMAGFSIDACAARQSALFAETGVPLPTAA